MSEMNDYYVDNHNGTITKKYGDSEVNYNILVGKNIPDDESILDYYHSQFESELKDALENEGIGYDQFCSGTALAMALAIVRGEQDITPKDILYWGENDEIVNWGGNGLKDWERDTGVNEVYDNRHSETDGAHYSSHIGDIANDDEAHLNEIKYILSLGHPVIVHVEGHFVVIVGVVDGVELKDATVGQLVIFDPGANETITNRITTMSDRGYEISDHRIITPYLIDDNKNLVLDENGEPTMDPYYLDPLYYDLEGNVLPEEEGKRRKETKEAIENSVNNTNLPQHEKDRIISELESAYNCKDIAESKAVENENVFGRISSIIKTVIDAVTQASKTSYDPLIFDLDGDGFNIESKENGTNFDLDKNGFAERINWTKKDGFLCLDLNGNGIIDNGGELFGDQTLLADGTKAKNGFEALAQYDSNGDGVIDENDEIFDKLRIWVDANGNGISDEGEMMTLRELGITSINLNYETTNGETGTEATIGNSASFTREDGTTGGIGELWVSADLYDTVDRTDIEIPDEIKKLPDICSIGNVYSLHVAMALDETGELKALVESFAVEQDVDKRMELVEKILYFICGANDVKDGSRGEYMDAKQLAVLEAMLGEKYVGTTGANPHSDAAPMLKEAYKDLLDMYYNELNIQTHIKNYVPLLRYTENEDGSKILNADLLNYILEYKLANGDEDAKNILADIARYVKYLDNGGIEGMYSFAMNYSIISAEYAAVIADIMDNGYVADGENPLTGTSGADFLVGSDNSEIIKGNAGNDILIGGKGDDTLYGGAGNDTYIFNLGDGNDVINENNSNSASDKLVFGEGISVDDIEVIRIGNDMVLKIKGTDDSVRIVNQYSDSWYRVENFEFADGTNVNADYFYNTSLTIEGNGTIKDFTGGYGTRDTTLIGSDEADVIYGYGGNDILIGGKGDDTLYGGAGNDTYIFNLGDGNDIINEDNSNSASDKLVFGEGISVDDIEVIRIGNDMVLKIKGTDDSVRIVNQYSDSWYRVENFEFADGTSVNADYFYNTSLTIEGSGTIKDFTGGYGTRDTTLIGSDEADTIYGYGGNDILIGGKGDDILYGGAGNDTYIFNLGDGNDVINEDNSNSASDKLVFGEGISVDDIEVIRIGNDMVLKIKGTDDSVRIVNQYSDSWYRVENFEFADGTSVNADYFYNVSLTIKGSGVINDFSSGYGNRSTTIFGSDEADTINAYDGDDYIESGLGDDVIYGGAGNDTIIGGKGDDKLYGGAGNDTYIFNLGDGNDMINEDNSNSSSDKLVFGEGISVDDIEVIRIGNDMVLKIKGTDDSVRIVNQYSDSWYRVENFEFADGASVNADYFYNTSLTIEGSGTIKDFTGGYGTRDTTLIGSDESDVIYGYGGNDILIGGKGDDILYGGAGNDIYIFNLGDGNDVINEDNSNSASDKLVFGEGISVDDIEVSRIGNDMVLKIKGTDDSIRIVNQYSDSWYRVENFEFADGTSVNADYFYNVSLTIKGSGVIGDFTGGYGTRDTILIGSDEADEIYGYGGDDILIGGKGDDILYGGAGNDTYIFNPGDGNDVINEQNSNSASDSLLFGEGISVGGIVFERSGKDLKITFVGSSDSVTIINQCYDSWYYVENFVTSDGYSISSSQINLLIQAMASFEVDTGMSWTEAVEQGNETANDIISQMWVKSAS